MLLTASVDLTRDPWGGRDVEPPGAGSPLAGIMVGELIRGVQSDRIVSTVERFALNPQEALRMTVDLRIGEAVSEGRDAPIAAAAAANRKSIVVPETGGPVPMPWLGKVLAA